MKRRGFNGPSDIADAALEQIPVALAQRGDLVLHPSGALGIAYGRHGFFLTPDSVTMIDVSHCAQAWAVS